VARSVELATPRDLDLDAAVQEEVSRLPEKYRAPIVLCDLEGRTHQEAARCLGWPIGTVKSRQSLARGLIRDRLAQRGLGLAVAGSLVESLKQTALAAIPNHVSRSTVSTAMQQSARLLTGCVVSAHVLTLTQRVLRAMLWIRVRVVATAILAGGIASGGASVYMLGFQEPTTNAQSPQAKTTKASTGKPTTAAPPARLRAQQLATRKAKASYEIARSTRELAEIAVAEYQDLNYPRDLATIEREIKLAEADLTRSKERALWAKRMLEKKSIPKPQKIQEDLNVQKAKFALEQCASKLEVLKKYTSIKIIKALTSEVDKAIFDELAKKEAWNLEKAKEAEMERQFRPGTH
jgi:hypothetical protein